MAHNLFHQLQMLLKPFSPGSLAKRPSAWAFKKLDTIRHRIIQRACSLVGSQAKLTLTMSANRADQNDLVHYLDILQKNNIGHNEVRPQNLCAVGEKSSDPYAKLGIIEENLIVRTPRTGAIHMES